MGLYSRSTRLQPTAYAAVLVMVLYASTAKAQVQTEVTGELHMHVLQQMYGMHVILHTVAL